LSVEGPMREEWLRPCWWLIQVIDMSTILLSTNRSQEARGRRSSCTVQRLLKGFCMCLEG
jgi:hypothetical protein